MNDNIPSNPAPWNEMVSIYDRHDRKALTIATYTLVASVVAGFVTAAFYENDLMFNWSIGSLFGAICVGNAFIAFNDKGRRAAVRTLLGKGRWSLPDGAVGSLKDSSRDNVEFGLATGRAVFTEREIRALAQASHP
ncbi:hypothetical protein [Rhizobium sp. BK176]|uniref:hypothetical protein n=1 Tax=Rhizobium sp. BK176 TaxID=2587071 RepID=UPI00216A2305|nr:hypothetical protein [Rhizobium sp. BK176]MCS4089559.1 hypothetical protein [Rhizobium sp. BK176]